MPLWSTCAPILESVIEFSNCVRQSCIGLILDSWEYTRQGPVEFGQVFHAQLALEISGQLDGRMLPKDLHFLNRKYLAHLLAEEVHVPQEGAGMQRHLLVMSRRFEDFV